MNTLQNHMQLSIIMFLFRSHDFQNCSPVFASYWLMINLLYWIEGCLPRLKQIKSSFAVSICHNRNTLMICVCSRFRVCIWKLCHKLRHSKLTLARRFVTRPPAGGQALKCSLAFQSVSSIAREISSLVSDVGVFIWSNRAALGDDGFGAGDNCA